MYTNNIYIYDSIINKKDPRYKFLRFVLLCATCLICTRLLLGPKQIYFYQNY